MIRAYYRLTKPGIIYGNALTASAGFFLASRGSIDVWLLLAMLAGLSLIIAAAGAFNNYMDREIDKRMDRTKKRALVVGLIPGRKALIYGFVLVACGSLILGIFTNTLTLVISLGGLIVYIVPYGYFKRRSSLGTVVGSIAGAVPPVVGYCAVTNHLDGAAPLLFLILVFWQMPHFYAIAIYRFKDYKTAGLPVLPVKKGFFATKVQMLLYITGFIITSLLLSVLGYTGYVYLLIVGLIGLAWLGLALKGFITTDDSHWARQMFRCSLGVTLGLSIMLSIGGRLP